MSAKITTASAFRYAAKSPANSQGYVSWSGEAEGVYSGPGEFFSGIREGDLVTVVEERGSFADGREAAPRYTIQGIGERAGAWLSFYGTVEVAA